MEGLVRSTDDHKLRSKLKISVVAACQQSLAWETGSDRNTGLCFCLGKLTDGLKRSSFKIRPTAKKYAETAIQEFFDLFCATALCSFVKWHRISKLDLIALFIQIKIF